MSKMPAEVAEALNRLVWLDDGDARRAEAETDAATIRAHIASLERQLAEANEHRAHTNWLVGANQQRIAELEAAYVAYRERAESAERQLAEVTARAEGLAWQPIETAPKDGTYILLGNYGGEEGNEGRWVGDASRNYWGETGWFYTDDDVLCEHPSKPDCWMRLPTTPAAPPATPEPEAPTPQAQGGEAADPFPALRQLVQEWTGTHDHCANELEAHLDAMTGDDLRASIHARQLENLALVRATPQRAPGDGDWYTMDGVHHVDWDAKPSRLLSIMLKPDGTVGFAAYADGKSFHGDAMSGDFWRALAALTSGASGVGGGAA